MRKVVSLYRVLAEFQQLPSHLTEELHLFSIDDLIKVKRGQLGVIAKAVLRAGAAHVETCEVRYPSISELISS